MTKSWPSAAACGVGAVRPPNFSAHDFALAGVLLNNRHLVAPLFDEMPCHGETHNAETEKSDFSHVCDPGVLPAPSSLPDGMLEKGRWAGSALETVPPRMWSAHNKPCAMKGNGSVWRGGYGFVLESGLKD